MTQRLKELLQQVEKGKLTAEEAFQQLKPYETLGYAMVDIHREARTGFPEVIFGEGKTAEQIVGIILRLMEHHDKVLVTRVSEEKGERIKKLLEEEVPEKQFMYHQAARLLYWQSSQVEEKQNHGYIAVVTAGTSDLPIAEEAAITAELFGNKVERIYDVGVAGIHRLFPYLPVLEKANAIIVVAGMEGALASVIGGLVSKPVIAVPTSVGYGANLEGVTTLLSMVSSCAPGVAVVNIDNGFGAGYYAATIAQTIEKAIQQGG